ncbi:MAG TPA: ATP synthase F1 subunit delta [Dehalococcoidales bacterium]|nr:ATP synthase F1 subunit delta [Dehalococcoidales bacterium]
MPRKAYARRYAQAVFEIALEKKELERWQSDLEKVVGATGDAVFKAALESPKIKIADKQRLLSERLGDISPLALNLVLMLISRGFVGALGKVAGEYRRLLDAYRGIQTAEVVTAVPLDDKDKEKLAERLSALVGSQVILKTEVSPEILGGIVARVGGKLLDGSTRSKLAALKRELVGVERKR